MKLLKTLKENGLDLSEIIENLSNSDDSDGEENENEDDEIKEVFNIKSIKNKKMFHNDFLKLKEKEKEKNINKDIEESDLSNVSFGALQCHEEFNVKKIPKGLKSIPKLKINDIKNEDL